MIGIVLSHVGGFTVLDDDGEGDGDDGHGVALHRLDGRIGSLAVDRYRYGNGGAARGLLEPEAYVALVVVVVRRLGLCSAATKTKTERKKKIVRRPTARGGVPLSVPMVSFIDAAALRT